MNSLVTSLRARLAWARRFGVLNRPLYWLWACGVAGLGLTITQGSGVGGRFTLRAPVIDGKIGWNEWQGAKLINTREFQVLACNDHSRLFLLFNFCGALKEDVQDDLKLTFDVNGDGLITPDEDLNYALTPETRTLRYQFYLGPGQLGSLRTETRSAMAAGFSASVADGSIRASGLAKTGQPGLIIEPHRVWELAIDLREIKGKLGGRVRFAFRAESPSSGLVIEPVKEFTRDFSNLMEVELAAGPVLVLGADAGATLAFDADPIEVTQAVQTRANTLPLVAHKTTAARVYLTAQNATRPQTVTVYLYGSRSGVDLPGSPLSVSFRAPLSIDRNAMTATPIFMLPASWLEGAITLRASAHHAYAGTISSGTESVTFTHRATPTIWIVPANFGTVSSPVLPADSDIAEQEEYMRALYPVPDINFVRQSWTAIGPTTEGQAIPDLNEFFGQVVVGWLFGFLFTGSPPFDLPAQVYGFCPAGGGCSDPTWCGRNGYVARGYFGTSGQGTIAHEINHNLDRSTDGTWGRHAKYGCGAAGPDPQWPYANDDSQETGFDCRADLSDPAALPIVPGSRSDIMSYCYSSTLPRKWISPYRWTNLFNVFPSGTGVSSDSPLPEARLGRARSGVYHVSGAVDVDGTGTLDPVMILPGIPDDNLIPGKHSIEVLGARGVLLSRTLFQPIFEDADGNRLKQYRFHFQIATAQGAVEIVLRDPDTVLARRTLSANAPTVTVVQPNGGEFWQGGRQTITWTAEDADKDILTFSVHYTPNDGVSWQPVARGLKSTSYIVDSSSLPGGQTARIRVIANDGFHTAQDDSDKPFVVAGKPPHPRIRRPQASEELLAGSPIIFEGTATDLEDGVLPDTAFRWYADGVLFAVGAKVQAALAAGSHEIKLTAEDSVGNIGEQKLTINLLALPRLHIAPLPGRLLRLSWAAAESGALQEADHVLGPYRDTTQPLVLEGRRLMLDLEKPVGTKFYRLSAP